MEKWKDIPHYEGYQVSNLGRVRTKNKKSYTKKHGIRNWQNRILKFKGESRETGYRVDLWKEGKPHTMLVARLTAFTFLGEDISNHKLTVNHIDGDRLNNKIENLELVSLKDNIRHGFRANLYTCQKKVKIRDKITGTIIYPSSLKEGSILIRHHKGYLSEQLKKGKHENDRYEWWLL